MNTLIAVDLDHEPERIVDNAAAWAARMRAQVDVAYVDPYAHASLSSRIDLASSVAAEIRALGDDTDRRLQALLERIPEPLRGASHRWDGTVAEEIAERSDGYDLVFTGTHDRSGIGHLVFGSNAERIARASHSPVVVLRNAPGAGDPLRMLCAVDIAKDASVLVKRLVPLAHALGAVVDLGYVEDIVASLPTAMSAAIQPGMAEHLAARRAMAETALAALRDTLPFIHRGDLKIDAAVPGNEIARWGEGYDLVVTGSHGRTGLERLWLGSVAEKVVRTCPRSVLVIPTVDA